MSKFALRQTYNRSDCERSQLFLLGGLYHYRLRRSLAQPVTIKAMAKLDNDLMWQLQSAAEHYVLDDWTHGTERHVEWAHALALCMDKFARDWVKANCSGKQRI